MLGNLCHTVVYGLACSLLCTFDEATLGDSDVRLSMFIFFLCLWALYFLFLVGCLWISCSSSKAPVPRWWLLANGSKIFFALPVTSFFSCWINEWCWSGLGHFWWITIAHGVCVSHFSTRSSQIVDLDPSSCFRLARERTAGFKLDLHSTFSSITR